METTPGAIPVSESKAKRRAIPKGVAAAVVALGPTVGVALAIAWVIDRVSARARPVLLALCAGVIAHGAWVGRRYSAVWSSHRTLWERLVETSPTEYRGYQLLGIDAREHGDTARALPLLARAFAMEPRDRRVRFEYGQVLYSTARYVALYIGVAQEQLGRFAAADSAYGVGLRAQPRDTVLQARRAALERRAAPR